MTLWLWLLRHHRFKRDLSLKEKQYYAGAYGDTDIQRAFVAFIVLFVLPLTIPVLKGIVGVGD